MVASEPRATKRVPTSHRRVSGPGSTPGEYPCRLAEGCAGLPGADQGVSKYHPGNRRPLTARLRVERCSGMAEKRARGRRWAAVRLLVMRRADYKCEKCGRPVGPDKGSDLSAEIHHVDGERSHFDPERLLCWCRACHLDHHRPPVSDQVAAWQRLVKQSVNTNYPLHK